MLEHFSGKFTTKSVSMRSCTICLFSILLVCFTTNGQTVNQIVYSQKPTVNYHSSTQLSSTINSPADSMKIGLYERSPFNIPASNYYTNSLGFFCKKEIEIEKALKFPVKFRLGSVAYTDKMEGKGCASFSASINK